MTVKNLHVLIGFVFSIALSGQALKLAPDQAGCQDSKYFPKLLECRIDNCEKKDSDRREIAVSDDDQGDAVRTVLEGTSKALMYECREGTTPASIVEKAAIALKAAAFEIPYKFSDQEASLTARRENYWVTVEAASRFYTLVEMEAASPPDYETANDADSFADMIDRYGHVPLNGIQFLTGKADLAPASDAILDEVVTMLKDHPAWRLRIEGHTDNVGPKTSNLNLSFFRAQAVVAMLVFKGVKRSRLEPQGLGDTKPVADNGSESGRAKNRRIELVRIAGPAGQ